MHAASAQRVQIVGYFHVRDFDSIDFPMTVGIAIQSCCSILRDSMCFIVAQPRRYIGASLPISMIIIAPTRKLIDCLHSGSYFYVILIVSLHEAMHRFSHVCRRRNVGAPIVSEHVQHN